jgi:hypothetical protein
MLQTGGDEQIGGNAVVVLCTADDGAIAQYNAASLKATDAFLNARPGKAYPSCQLACWQTRVFFQDTDQISVDTITVVHRVPLCLFFNENAALSHQIKALKIGLSMT